MRITLWTNSPTHHQRAFLHALREEGVDLSVNYYRQVGARHQALGWAPVERLPAGERFVEPSISALDTSDWRQQIHIVAGYRAPFFRQLVRALSSAGVPWPHWSEPAHPGFRWWASYPVKRWYASMINRHALCAMAIGEPARRDFIRWGVRKDMIEFLPYAVTPGSIHARPDDVLRRFASPFECAFLYLGALEPRKGTDTLLKAFANVARRHSNSCLLLVGSDNGGGVYQRMAGRGGAADRICFRGPVPADRIDTALAACDVVVLPSRFDGWGMALNEGAGVGKALIGSDRCGSSFHLIRDGVNGFFVRAENVDDLAEAMSAYCVQPSLAWTHGECSLDIFEAFTPERNAQRLIRIIEERHTSARAEGWPSTSHSQKV